MITSDWKPYPYAVHPIESLMVFRTFALVFFLVVFVGGAVAADQKPDPAPSEIQNIIQKFTAKETEFAAARENYTYRQSSKIQETDPAGGSYEVVENVSFDDRNRRTSHVVHAPVTSLQNILMTNEDEQDLRNVMPFVFTTADADEYDVKYVGRENVDEISCYVFTIKPKSVTKENRKKRYFEGQAWVDDQDLQIVKTYGKGIGYQGRNEDQQFPKFTTYREQIDGHYWFPTYTYADDTLNFKDGQAQRIKVVVKYTDYKKYEFKTQTSITFGEVGGAAPPPVNAPAPH
jgi:outer membrane lipoprotein-sorting protein